MEIKRITLTEIKPSYTHFTIEGHWKVKTLCGTVRNVGTFDLSNGKPSPYNRGVYTRCRTPMILLIPKTF